MRVLPDWADLWRELVALNDRWSEVGEAGDDPWNRRARSYSEGVVRRWSRPDSSRDFLVSRLSEQPAATLLDIGAGTGAWASLAARHAASVTAIERSPGMIEVMRKNLVQAGISNVRILQGIWPDVEVEPHDFSMCSHAMYGAPDFPHFIRKMVAVTRRTCILLIRVPSQDGLMAEFARLILGHPHDSPNFVIAYNALIEMGICANVLFEDSGLWKGWTSDSLEEALASVKSRLGLKQDPRFDEIILRRLEEELVYREGKYVWPQAVRSALVYWDIQ